MCCEQEVAMAASGRNWGDAVVDNETLQFTVGSKPLFSVALPDVTQVRNWSASNPQLRPNRAMSHCISVWLDAASRCQK